MAPVKRPINHQGAGVQADQTTAAPHRRPGATAHPTTVGAHTATRSAALAGNAIGAFAGNPFGALADDAVGAFVGNPFGPLAGDAVPADAQERKAHLMLRVRENADRSVNTTEALKVVVSDVAREIAKSIFAIGRANERHEASIRMMQELELQAATIGQVVKTVALIADQTNRLTLNAVLDAPHAGDHRKDLTAVIGDGRTLVATAETSPDDLRTLLARIQHDVNLIAVKIQSSATAAREELVKGRQSTEALGQIHSDMSGVITAAAEEQASAIEEINRAAAQITIALDQCRCSAYSCE